ncbi:hypothetical protein [Natrarchaeobius oligotrophus]|uniref:Uncharacterized protein n=1 Tax=Natrarchaeobius chitinivorans TaxID=1679083 RepID=A0A3N6N643_NATCH|nr:hypothetical protein [Natrarchaeobius chitinivorans]RQH03387.1 hypothetical protein EA472_02135 [Natrarchaeobius chitinivorans]
MASTRNYDRLLEFENVVGVDYDETERRVTVFVSDDTRISAEDVRTRLAEPDGVEVRFVDPSTGEAAPSRQPSLDPVISSAFATASLSLESASIDGDPSPGESIEVSVTVRAEPGTYWLSIDAVRADSPESDRSKRGDDDPAIVSVSGRTDSPGRAVVTLPVSVPDETTGPVSVRICGGPLDDLE